MSFSRLEPMDFAARRRSLRPAAQRSRVRWVNPAWITIAASLMLTLVGVYCINLTAGVNSDGFSSLAMKQLALLALGVLAGAFIAAPDYRWIGRLSPLLIIATLGALVFVMLPWAPEALVTPRNGARRWINLGVTDFQPSELAKIAYVIAVARYLRFRENHRRFLGLAPPAIITFVPMGLILIEPDLGTALLFLPALFAMLVAAGAKLKHLLIVCAIAMATAPAMYPLLQPHQKARIQAVVNQVTGDESGRDTINYQGDRAMTLVGAGGAVGMGAKKSRAVIHFNALPEDHNDMIFAVVANRFGLLGTVGLLGLYLLWVGGALLTAATCTEPFGRLLAVGLAAIVATQMTINIGMTVGLLPITGMTLPFVSAGGASLIVSYMMAGFILNIGLRRPLYLQRKSFEFSAEDGA